MSVKQKAAQAVAISNVHQKQVNDYMKSVAAAFLPGDVRHMIRVQADLSAQLAQLVEKLAAAHVEAA